MTAVALCGLSFLLPATAQETLSHGRFHGVKIYRPAGDTSSVALFLSSEAGWDASTETLAQDLTKQHALVIGIETPQFFNNLNHSAHECLSPDGDLENLSHFVQGYAKLPTYHTPLLIGYRGSASFAYLMLAQAPTGTFAGAISIDFCPDIAVSKPLCRRTGLAPSTRSSASGITVSPLPSLPAPWMILQGDRDRRCPLASVRTLAKNIADVELTPIEEALQNDAADGRRWQPLLIDSYQRLAARHATTLPTPPASLGDLPIVEVMATGAPASRFAVILSGDGGWAGLDRSVAAALAAKGIAVVGFDSLRYFWRARTPEGLATDLDRTIRFYASHWQKSGVILAGYSQGADVLPFAVNRLTPETRALVARTVLIGPGKRASFEFHLGNWLGAEFGGAPILPEANLLTAGTTLCLYGADESGSLCPQITASNVRIEVLPGGHHFGGAYDALAARILNGL
ncbi:MAG: virulence factor family protein [Steroidobacter sp.]|nr:virulence factor family protein [Steroidobacter sp.]